MAKVASFSQTVFLGVLLQIFRHARKRCSVWKFLKITLMMVKIWNFCLLNPNLANFLTHPKTQIFFNENVQHLREWQARKTRLARKCPKNILMIKIRNFLRKWLKLFPARSKNRQLTHSFEYKRILENLLYSTRYKLVINRWASAVAIPSN